MASDEERVEILVDVVFDGAESEDNQAGDIPQLPPAERSETFTFTSSREFLLLRWLLRGLSLWHPRSSCCFSRYLYPGLISLLLAYTAILTVVLLCLHKDAEFFNSSLSSKLYFVLVFASAYFSHLAGWVYFRSRDFEDNVTPITLDARQLERFRKQIKYYNLRTALSSLIASAWLGYNIFFYIQISSLEMVYLYNPSIMDLQLLFGSVYATGMYFAVLWVIDILQLVSNARLRNQHQKFLKWTQGAEAAINDHICHYTTKVETSCRRLRFWFLIHNVSLTILVPIIVLSNLAHATRLKLVAVTFIAIAFIAIYILIWTGLFYFAEQIGINDERFCCEVNNFCPEQLTTAMQNTAPRETAVATLNGDQNEENYQHLTFVSRTEVQLLVAYLKNIRSGFLAVGYTFQLKLSIVAAVFSLGALLFKTNFFKTNFYKGG